MLKKIFLIGLFVGLVGLLVVGAVNRTLAKNEGENSSEEHSSHTLDDQYATLPGLDTAPETGGSLDENTVSVDSQALPAGDGSAEAAPEEVGAHPFLLDGTFAIEQADIDALVFMREEEKLAHDVYQLMYALWGKPVFQNISYSEQAHSEAVLALLESYGIPDTASSQPGVFTNTDLQALYDQLTAQGSQSLTDALLVGAAIEEIDILDLQSRLDQTANPDIQQVFTSLLLGSGNHLRAFSSMLGVETGSVYQPQYLSPAAYQAILAEAGTGAGTGVGQGRGSGNGRWANP